jgi:hypothetical protein
VVVWGRMDKGVLIRCMSGDVVRSSGGPICWHVSGARSAAEHSMIHKASAASGGITK